MRISHDTFIIILYYLKIFIITFSELPAFSISIQLDYLVSTYPKEY